MFDNISSFFFFFCACRRSNKKICTVNDKLTRVTHITGIRLFVIFPVRVSIREFFFRDGFEITI